MKKKIMTKCFFETCVCVCACRKKREGKLVKVKVKMYRKNFLHVLNEIAMEMECPESNAEQGQTVE